MNIQRLPLKRDLKPVYMGSLIVAAIMAVVSAAGILYWSSLYPAARAASSVGSDAFNLVVILPILLVSMWFAYRGRLTGLLLWPGALFYLLYIYTFYAIGLPANALFPLYIALVALSLLTVIGLIISIDGVKVRQRLSGFVPRRASGGILIGLALLFTAIDANTIVTTLAGHEVISNQMWATWVSDLVVECPALLIGGILLWMRMPLGYAAGAGLLLQIGLLTVGVPISFLLGDLLTGSPIDTSSAMLLIIGVIPLILLIFFLRDMAWYNDPGPA